MDRRSVSGKTGVHLAVDARVTHKDLEGAHVTPGVVPGVNTEPVVRSVLSAPADRLDGVTTESRASGVLVDTRLVGKEVLVDCEGRCDGTVLLDLSLDVLDTPDAIAAGSEVLVISVGAIGIIDAGFGALGLDLFDVVAKRKGLAVDVMGALLHGVVEAGACGAVVTSSDDTGVGEPFPGGANLTTVAAHGLAVEEVAAGSGVGDGQESSEASVGRDANTIVEGLGGTVSPA